MEFQKPHFAENGPSAEHQSEAIDSERVFIFLNKLKRMLEEDDFRAVGSFEILRAALPTGMNGEELYDLEKHIGGYDFVNALKALCVVEKILKDKLK